MRGNLCGVNLIFIIHIVLDTHGISEAGKTQTFRFIGAKKIKRRKV